MATPSRATGTTSDERVSDWAVQYSQTDTGPFGRPTEGRVRVDLLTDPWSVWCWGFEPVRRALTHRYPSIEFHHYMGGMFEHLPDPQEMGFDLDRFFGNVQRTTGMPIASTAVREDRPKSTFPACIHWHTVRLLRPDLEGAYLRALREAVYLDGWNASNPARACEVAERVGIDAAEFGEALASGEPEREFRTRMEALHRMQLHAYPTFIITYRDKTGRVEGFQSLAGVLSIAESISGRLHASVPPPGLEVILRPRERMATREVAEALGESLEATYDRLVEAERDGSAGRERHATGDVWRRIT